MGFSWHETGRFKPAVLLAAALAVLCAASLLASCGGSARDTSTPHAALLGQWKPASSGHAFIFFTPDTATYVPAEGGEHIAIPYEVVEEDAGGLRISIRYLNPGDSGDGVTPFTIEFSEDYGRFFLYPADVPERLEYVYVDGRQQP